MELLRISSEVIGVILFVVFEKKGVFSNINESQFIFAVFMSFLN